VPCNASLESSVKRWLINGSSSSRSVATLAFIHSNGPARVPSTHDRRTYQRANQDRFFDSACAKTLRGSRHARTDSRRDAGPRPRLRADWAQDAAALWSFSSTRPRQRNRRVGFFGRATSRCRSFRTGIRWRRGIDARLMKSRCRNGSSGSTRIRGCWKRTTPRWRWLWNSDWPGCPEEQGNN
jgi:hypothetical protein